MHMLPLKMHPLLKELKRREIQDCGTMEGIVGFEGEVDGDVFSYEACFSKLTMIILLGLPNLVSFCTICISLLQLLIITLFSWQKDLFTSKTAIDFLSQISMVPTLKYCRKITGLYHIVRNLPKLAGIKWESAKTCRNGVCICKTTQIGFL